MMPTVQQKLWSGQPESPNTTYDLDGLLESFNRSDMRLMLAIDQDEPEVIAAIAIEVDIKINQLFEFECNVQSEKMKLSRFLIDRFVIGDNTSDKLKMRVFEKILTFVG